MTEKKPASEQKLNALHDALADQLIERVNGTEIREEVLDPETEEVKEVKVTTARASAAELAVAAKFLKDNSVTMQPGEGNKLGDLQKALDAKRKPTKADARAALAQIGSDLLQ